MAEFVSHRLSGHEGMVRSLFANRSLAATAASDIFPGVRAVAILPDQLPSIDDATDYLRDVTEPGGNAAAVKISDTDWVIGAWVESP